MLSRPPSIFDDLVIATNATPSERSKDEVILDFMGVVEQIAVGQMELVELGQAGGAYPTPKARGAAVCEDGAATPDAALDADAEKSTSAEPSTDADEALVDSSASASSAEPTPCAEPATDAREAVRAAKMASIAALVARARELKAELASIAARTPVS